jgi:uncharacterized protein DUF4430
VRPAALLLLALVLAGCGGGERGRGTATLWVTRDRGAHVVYSGSVPAGLNGVQAVERKLKVTTRYGGRYLQSLDGIEGSLGAQRDWFFYVNGKEGGRSAAEVRLRAGDVLWWDYRRWTGATMHLPVVAGAWPHPFVDSGPTSVVSPNHDLAAELAKQVRGTPNSKSTSVKSFVIVARTFGPDHVHIKPYRDGYLLELGMRIAARLAKDDSALRYRF